MKNIYFYISWISSTNNKAGVPYPRAIQDYSTFKHYFT
ncbi:Uncharacterised protein [Capnocytophaga ochracea]|uniref:Uncharacterized protein n=1 Tax=Capnocytophaga ochracea TaxID=1018 RepID=A0A2X2SQ35_CAPOC|nr:Uncharacterised protein [Capnocytophaga ochracea]